MPNDDIDTEIEMAACNLGLTLDDTWRPHVKSNLVAIRTAIALLEAFPFPDEIDQAPVYEA